MTSFDRFAEHHTAPGLRALAAALVAAALVGLGGCASPPPEPVDLLAPTEEQMKIRNLQTRTFDISDRRAAIRGVIQALQDLGFIIERANEPLGIVTGARFAEPNYYDVVGITVTIRASSATQITIRAKSRSAASSRADLVSCERDSEAGFWVIEQPFD